MASARLVELSACPPADDLVFLGIVGKAVGEVGADVGYEEVGTTVGIATLNDNTNTSCKLMRRTVVNGYSQD